MGLVSSLLPSQRLCRSTEDNEEYWLILGSNSSHNLRSLFQSASG